MSSTFDELVCARCPAPANKHMIYFSVDPPIEAVEGVFPDAPALRGLYCPPPA